MLSSLTTTVLRDLATELGLGGTSDSLTTLKDALRKVPDPRHRRGVRYPFLELLLTIVCAVVSGAKTLTMITEWAPITSSR